MKITFKAILLLACTICLSHGVNAQYSTQPIQYNRQPANTIETETGYKDAFGIRFGSTSGITYKHKFGAYNAMEIILGTYPHAVGVTGLYERYLPTSITGLNIYLGAGAHIARGYYSYWGYTYNADNDQYYYYTRSFHYGPIIGVDAIGGAEYKFQNVPVALSLDVKPYAEFYRGKGPYTRLDPSLGVKFTF